MRLLGITIPDNKRLEIGLTTIFGIGRSRAHEILKKAGVDFGLKAKDVSVEQENVIRKAIETYLLEAAGMASKFRSGASERKPTQEREEATFARLWVRDEELLRRNKAF